MFGNGSQDEEEVAKIAGAGEPLYRVVGGFHEEIQTNLFDIDDAGIIQSRRPSSSAASQVVCSEGDEPLAIR